MVFNTYNLYNTMCVYKCIHIYVLMYAHIRRFILNGTSTLSTDSNTSNTWSKRYLKLNLFCFKTDIL